ncbi:MULTISPECIES: porin family protein [Niastella]|uniref:PorT family protein n=1 Tax=Niastella soli TaxID=2821487 RepID=A0ABS3Z211_9BACT|nr:porin family protein [Niastella soli]MBO9203441.1 PorT family protein [Niastella soli]
MKLKSLALLTIASTLTSLSFAQGFHIGAKAGANIFKVDGTSMKDEFNFGYNVGAFAELNFSDKIGIQPEVMWNQTNYRTGDHFGSIYPHGVDDVKGKLNYLSIPVLLNVSPAKFLTLQAGPQFGILLNHDKTLVDNGQEAFKKGDFSMLGGVQLNIGSFKLGGRYVVGLANINDIDNKEKWKNQGFQVYLGTRIL